MKKIVNYFLIRGILIVMKAYKGEKDEKINEDYILGLDIGTNSCGWAVTDKKITY